MHTDTRRVIASLLQSPLEAITVEMPSTQKQTNGSDCGLYALAFAMTIVDGGDPGATFYDRTQLRAHLRRCLQEGVMTKFPEYEEGVFPPVLPTENFKIDLSCPCRLPSSRSMKVCQRCSVRCHVSCLWEKVICNQCVSQL